jgi:L-aminopeptidase/D-esterase-like protein
MNPGPYNAITDVPGVKIGHHTHLEGLTGTTVIRVEQGAVAGVDVRGSAPGTRETDLLNPINRIEQVQAVVLTGGSAYGLESVTGVMRWLEEHGHGLPIDTGGVVPIVPAAVLFDLKVGSYSIRPTAEHGYLAAQNAKSGPLLQGCVGAGTGAKAGGLKGGIGSASVVLENGLIIGAIAAVNSFGRLHHPKTGALFAHWLELGNEFNLPKPSGLIGSPLDYSDMLLDSPLAGQHGSVGRNTTIGVVATNASLSKTQAQKIAQMAHDGMARAIFPIHTMMDGDVIFSLALGMGQPETQVTAPATLSRLGAVAADVFARACIHGLLNARSMGGLSAYSEAFPPDL